MTLFGIISSINVIDISRQTIYGTYRNEKFFLIKINKPPPKINNSIINDAVSISFEYYMYLFKNCLQKYINSFIKKIKIVLYIYHLLPL